MHSPGRPSRTGNSPGRPSRGWNHPLRSAPERTIADLRRRARAGLPLERAAVRNTGLFERARRDFGGWSEALEAAGIQSPRRRSAKAGRLEPPRKLKPLTESLLRSEVPTRAIARMTGYDRKTIRQYRKGLGIRMSERGKGAAKGKRR